MSLRTKALPFLAAVLLTCGLSAAGAQEKVWKHGILEAKSDSGFIAMVAKGGFAEKHGLKVELLQIKAGATLMKALISGELDSVDMGAAESIVAGMRGTGVKIVGCTWPGVPQVVLAKDDIKTLADLKGKRVAFGKGSSAHNLLVASLDKAGLSWSDITPAPLAPADATAAFVKGSVDAWSIWDPYLALAELKEKARVIAFDKDVHKPTRSTSPAPISWINIRPSSRG